MSLIKLLNQNLNRNDKWTSGWNTFWFFICQDLSYKNTQQAKRLLCKLCETAVTLEVVKDFRNEFKRTFTS